MTWLLDLDADAAGHIAVAIRRHRQWAAQQGVRLPKALSELQVKCELRATAGQRGTPLADLWEVAQSQNMPAQLMTYETAAAVLSVSPRTVKRLVADGSLTPVHVGSVPRIRVADLDAYVADLPVERKAS